MPITKKQREQRRKHLGSSDSPAVMGVDPWRSASDVYLEKVANTEDIEGVEAIEIGNAFEKPLIEWASEQLGIEFELNVRKVKPGTMFAANLDALEKKRGAKQGGEAKTTSMPKEYGAEGTDQVPDRVIVQAQHQMYVANLDVVWVPVLMAQYDRLQRKMFKVERNEKIIEGVEEGGAGFWNDHVLPRVPPDDYMPSPDVLARVRRVPGSIIAVDPELVANFETAKEKAAEWGETMKSHRVALLAAAGDAESMDYGDEDYIYAYAPQTREGIDVRQLKLRAPAVWELFAKESRPFRVLRRVKR